jgi:Tfp pilus assembly protein PilX
LYSNYCILPVVYNQFKALAVLSSSYVEKGQPIEITAGVGEFSTAMKPRITIDGKPVALNANDGTAVHRFTADGKPGKHNAMVRIEFTSPDGSTEYISKRLEYIIADEK